jgi:hypothetical protein
MNRSFRINVTPFLRGTVVRRGALFGAILVAALLAFELFNFATTSFALGDVLGDLSTAGLRWSTVLALAFCGIDFAGIARLFTPQQGTNEPAEVWYLFGAWLLAAAFNAALTWWGVSLAIASHTPEGSILVGRGAITTTIPVLVAAMVWLIRVLIIGTFSLAGESMFSISARDARPAGPKGALAAGYARPATRSVAPVQAVAQAAAPAAEPTYHPIGMSARSHQGGAGLHQ